VLEPLGAPSPLARSEPSPSVFEQPTVIPEASASIATPELPFVVEAATTLPPTRTDAEILADFLSPRSSAPPRAIHDDEGESETNEALAALPDAGLGAVETSPPAEPLEASAPTSDRTPLPSVIDTDTPRVETSGDGPEEEDVLPLSRPPLPRPRRIVQAAVALVAIAGAVFVARGTLQLLKRAPAAAVAAAPAPQPEVPPPAQPAVAPQVQEPASPEDVASLKKDALAALEKGKVDDAIDSAKRATELDDRDGDAWLLLGAAYQEKGRIDLARQCYATCATRTRNDPRGECAALVRSASLDYGVRHAWPASIPRPAKTAAPETAAKPSAKSSDPTRPVDLSSLAPVGDVPVAEPKAAPEPKAEAKPAPAPEKPTAPPKPANPFEQLKIE
jgi:hypothetical protein